MQRSPLEELERGTQSYIDYLNYEIDKEIKDAVRNLQTLIRDQKQIIAKLKKENPGVDYHNAEVTLANLAKVIDKESKEESRKALRAWLEDALDVTKEHKDTHGAEIKQDLMKQVIFASFQKSGKRAIEQGVNTDYAKLPQLIREYHAASKMLSIIQETSDAAQKKEAIKDHYSTNQKTFENGSMRGRSFSYIAGHLLGKLFGRNNNPFTIFQKPSEQFQKKVEIFRGVNPGKKL